MSIGVARGEVDRAGLLATITRVDGVEQALRRGKYRRPGAVSRGEVEGFANTGRQDSDGKPPQR
jgi:hypothetical protein